VLERIEPRFRHYQLLKTSLARYRELARDATVAPVTDLPRDVKPGTALRAAPRLRRLLAATGDLSRGSRPKPAADTLYSADLVQAVKRFQRRMGLLPDGVIWFQTAEELARPFEHRIRQIELALERWRWMPPSFDTPPVVVNLPAFRLYALRSPVDREQDILAMDVLAGSANSHETPSFTAEMTHVVFRPFWNPPLEIMTDELGTRALWDRENLESHGYVLVESDADDAPVLPMTPENLAQVGKSLRIRQRPGPQNALGLVKFMLPNPHEIYLHDTPAKGLFAMSRRDYSHGCIRVSEPVALAEHLLGQQPGWDTNRIREAMENGPDNVRVDLERPVPVYVLYATAAAAENGEVYFYSDVYGRDAELDALLRKGYPYPKTELRAELRTAADADQGRISTDVPSGTTR
jgi:murein L,D-transpeptidase YcbB/YkuD